MARTAVTARVQTNTSSTGGASNPAFPPGAYAYTVPAGRVFIGQLHFVASGAEGGYNGLATAGLTLDGIPVLATAKPLVAGAGSVFSAGQATAGHLIATLNGFLFDA